MNRSFTARVLASAFAVVLLISIAGCGSTGSGGSAEYTAKDLVTGDDVSTESLRGRPALLVSWTTWCTECDEELAGLQAFAESPAAEGIQIVAVNLDASDVTDEINAKIATHGLTTALWRDRRNDFKRVFATIGVPTTVVLDANGSVIGLFPGAVDFEDDAVLAALDQVRETQSP